jgi:uncharacterized pyridoxal phosphate-containing UPF0001 family protein
MKKKFSIIKTIDLNKLTDEIDKYIMQTGEANPYIFMHIDTMQAIDNAFTTDFREPIHTSDCKGAIGYWEGYRMFIDNSLEFGEVEIRQSECEHEWHMVGSVGGTKSRYIVHVCSKCGEQQTQRQVFNKKDGSYKIYILDEDT